MPASEALARRNAIPFLYTRGTHYEVGFDIGRTFSGIIHSFLAASKELNNVFLPLYNTEAGRQVYNETLRSVQTNFPQYVREIEGTADGAGVPFHKLFLLHLDDILPNVVKRGGSSTNAPIGCSTIVCNRPGEELLGHTEDALSPTLNHFYLVSAHVLPEPGLPQGRWKDAEERFTSLCYAGILPGFTMSYNHHGLAYSINVVSAATLVAGKTPRMFLTRALLSVEHFVQAQQVLRDKGCGAAEGFSVNMTFLLQEGDRLFHNAEVGPALPSAAAESQLNILTVSPGESFVHTNKYLRLAVPEIKGSMMESSDCRHKAISAHGEPENYGSIVNMLGDQTDPKFTVFQDKTDHVTTLAVGIFDCVKRTWSIYSDNPKKTEPIIVLPIQLKTDKK
nr:tan protein [Gryllus bimaculatus]